MIIGYQEWRDLLFLHFRVAASALRPLVPAALSIDERDGSAWVSATPFTLRRGRLRGLPPLPDFHELNFRTYVSHPGGGPGIWFFSLDAASAVAVAAARLSVRLPYYRARMERGVGWYRSERIASPARLEARWEVEAKEERAAAPGSIEEFLAERYTLFSKALGPVLWRGRVRHEKWLLQPARVTELQETLSAAAGFAAGPPVLAQWTRGVAVEFEPFVPLV
jgi:uncharacterized protein YqjF (DUF2071 family)